MTRMFKDPAGKKFPTLNPIVGWPTWPEDPKCEHQCVYCYVPDIVKDLAGRLKQEKYQNCGTVPALDTGTLAKCIKFSRVPYFVCSLHDLWGASIPDYVIGRVLEWCASADARNTFLFLTKNPKRYLDYDVAGNHDIILNFVYGATIESNIQHPEISKAPLEFERIQAFRELKGVRKFLSIEPVLQFEQAGFVRDIVDIAPEFVYVGYDNHGHGLPEPSEDELQRFMQALRDAGIEVREKTVRMEGNRT